MNEKKINPKVLLVQPNYRETRKSGVWGITPPLGLAYIAAVLEQNNITVTIIDANALNLTPQEVAKESKDYDIIGVSMMTPAHNFGVELIKLLPKNILKVCGGPHATGCSEDLLNRGFDIVVIGEGEYSFLDIALGKKLEKIEGIAYKINGEIKHNPVKPITNPDIIPFPARHLLLSNGVDLPYFSASSVKRHYSPIFTSRGCPFNCYYCNKKIFGIGFRPRSPENVVDEIEELVKKYGVREIDIYDDCFNIDLDRAEKILDMIIERKLKIIIRFSNGIRVDRITENILKKMKAAGCNYIAYGIESGNQEVLDKIPKNITLKQIKNAVKLTKKAGITVCGFFIFGLLGDTRETMQETIDFAKELDLDVASFNIATPYPGTRLYDEIKRNGKFLVDDWGIFHHTSGKMTFMHPNVASPKEVEKAYIRAHRQFYLRPQYILKQILKLHSFRHLKVMIRGAGTILKIQI